MNAGPDFRLGPQGSGLGPYNFGSHQNELAHFKMSVFDYRITFICKLIGFNKD